MKESIDRKPAVAGKFYPASPDNLQQEISELFAEATPKKYHNVRAIICPHAGYVFSGRIAASAFNQIDKEVSYKRVFILASSHHESFNGAAVYCDGDFVMPYGKETVDTDLGKQLVESFPDTFTSNRSPNLNEHSIEVQLPFLHNVLKTGYNIIPIVIGTSEPVKCKEIASALKQWLTSENLFIISSDFSHYPEYEDALKIDAITKDAILKNSPDILYFTLAENSKKHIPNLVTSLCGWTSVLTLLYMTSQNESLEYKAVEYSNSGDTKNYGEKDRVVGYWGICLLEKQIQENEFELSDKDKDTLLEIARKTIEELCRHKKRYNLDIAGYSPILKTDCGAFVTLHESGKLRGCIGRLVGNLPLYKMVQEMAVSAAVHDYRFMPVDAKELPFIDIEISVLSPMRKINDVSEIQLGKHGIYIEQGRHAGVFLPQVATETGWDLETFLGHCSRDKAGLEWYGWKSADIYIFTATVFAKK